MSKFALHGFFNSLRIEVTLCVDMCMGHVPGMVGKFVVKTIYKYSDGAGLGPIPNSKPSPKTQPEKYTNLWSELTPRPCSQSIRDSSI